MVTKARSCIWCDGNAREMAEYYVDVFPDSKIGRVQLYTSDQPEFLKHMIGKPLLIELTLSGHDLILLNAGDEAPPTDYFSIEIICEDQAEIDRIWNRLIEDGGEEGVCGWCKDKFGTSFQINPQLYYDLVGNPEVENAINSAINSMNKIIVADLEAAAAGA